MDTGHFLEARRNVCSSSQTSRHRFFSRADPGLLCPLQLISTCLFIKILPWFYDGKISENTMNHFSEGIYESSLNLVHGLWSEAICKVNCPATKCIATQTIWFVHKYRINQTTSLNSELLAAEKLNQSGLPAIERPHDNGGDTDLRPSEK